MLPRTIALILAFGCVNITCTKYEKYAKVVAARAIQQQRPIVVMQQPQPVVHDLASPRLHRISDLNNGTNHRTGVPVTLVLPIEAMPNILAHMERRQV